eukprot:scaffold600_cov68-Cylindrotheca_fusiformis.AAC.1
MPPPEMKTVSFPRPSLLELNSTIAEDFDKAMLPGQLLAQLKESVNDDKVAMVYLPAFGFLYVATETKVHQYDPNLLEFQKQPFQIVLNQDKRKKKSIVLIQQDLEEEASVKKPGSNILFVFPTTEEKEEEDFRVATALALEQAKLVAKQLEALLGCPEIKLKE